METTQLRKLAAFGLVVGSLLGMAGSFASSESVRGLLWGLDGTLLVMAGSALTVATLRSEQDRLACGFLVFTLGQALVLATAPMSLAQGAKLMVSGAALWAAATAIVSVGKDMPVFVRLTGAVATVIFAFYSLTGYMGASGDALGKPIPFIGYPFLSLTLIGWAWWAMRGSDQGA